jgi:Flp pilus assembly protein TadD
LVPCARPPGVELRSLHPTEVWALHNQGLAYLKLQERDKARRDFEEALRIDPAFERARTNLTNEQP